LAVQQRSSAEPGTKEGEANNSMVRPASTNMTWAAVDAAGIEEQSEQGFGRAKPPTITVPRRRVAPSNARAGNAGNGLSAIGLIPPKYKAFSRDRAGSFHICRNF
jgi:hypothetical protein